MSDFPIHIVDLVIIALYFAVVLTIGFVVARRTHSGEDLFLAGRSLLWPAIGFSLFASNISSTTLVGLAGDAYRFGVAISAYEWWAALILVFLAVVFVPFYIRSRISTVPEFLERRYGRTARLYFSAINIFLSVVVDTAGSLFAGALVLQVFFPGLDIWTTCIVLAVIAGIYTAAGGLAAVVYTDMIQAVILLIGTTALALIVFGEFDYSWAAATAALPAGHLDMIRPADDPYLPWPGLFTGVPLLGFYYWCTNQYIVQRVLGARDVSQARWGALLGGALKLTPLFIMVLPGAMALTLIPDLPDADQVFPRLVIDYLPVGLTGLVLAGLIAAIMSSIDSTLNSASTLVVMDFIVPWRPDLSPTQIGRIGRITTIVFMVLSAAWAPMISYFEGLFAYLQQVLAYAVPPIAVLFLLGVFWARGNRAGALAALVGGHLISIGLFASVQMEVIELHFTLVALVLALASAALFVGVSLLTAPPPREKVEGLTWSARMAEPALAVPPAVVEGLPRAGRGGGGGDGGDCLGILVTTARGAATHELTRRVALPRVSEGDPDLRSKTRSSPA